MSSSRSAPVVLALAAIVGVTLLALPGPLAAEPVLVSPPYLFGEEPPTPDTLAGSYGYSTEVHEVDSEGYLLTLFRIKGPRAVEQSDDDDGDGGKSGESGEAAKAAAADNNTLREPIVLQHGMAANAAQWVMFGHGRSLAYALADAGFDVWLASGRGSKYAKKHKEHRPESESFWDFSWHDQGVQDLPAVLDFVLNSTGFRQAWYVGHSMGSTMMFVMSALRPAHAAKVKHHFALAPTAFLGRVKNPVVVDFKKRLDESVQLWDNLGMHHFSSEAPLLASSRAVLCALIKSTCRQTLFYDTFGADESQSFENQAEITGVYLPGDFSVKQAVHFAQNAIPNESFRQFDHGDDNMMVYNASEPPEYDMSTVTVPTTFMYAASDQLTVPEDVVAFSKRFVRAPPRMHLVPLKAFNHGDFVSARDQAKYVHEPILAYAREIRQKTGVIPLVEQQVHEPPAGAAGGGGGARRRPPPG